jgi:hypothetical protein
MVLTRTIAMRITITADNNNAIFLSIVLVKVYRDKSILMYGKQAKSI